MSEIRRNENNKTKTLSKKKRAVYAIISITISIIFSLIIGEIGLRIIYREVAVNGNYWGIGAFSPNKKCGYVHKPGYEGFAYRKKVFNSFVKINKKGLRQSDLREQLKYKKKLLILGDSFAFGLGVDEEQSFPHLIKKNMNPIGIGIINGAQPGYSIEQELLLGESLIQDFKPEYLILALYPDNDISGDYLREFLNIDVKYGYRLDKRRIFKSGMIDYLRTHSYIYMLIKGYQNNRKIIKSSQQFKYESKNSLNTFIQPSFSNLLKFKKMCKQKNIVFGIVMIPPIRKKKTIFDNPLRFFFNEQNIPLLDLTALRFRTRHYFKRDGHWNAKGHAKASRLLSEFILQLINE